MARQMEQGADLGDALHMVQKDLTASSPCWSPPETSSRCLGTPSPVSPAAIAETDDYLAMASEYHAQAGLPGIGDARGVRARAKRGLQIEGSEATTAP